MTRGGKRNGAGRKVNPTKQVRIPINAAPAARAIAEAYLAKAWDKLRETVWWKTGPKEGVTLQLAGIERRPVGSLIGAGGERDFVVAVATSKIRLEGGDVVDETQEILLEI